MNVGVRSGLQWTVAELDELAEQAELQRWEDPVGRTPVWSRPDFRRVTLELPQHPILHLVAHRNGRPVLLAPVLRSERPGGLLFYDVPAMVGDERAFGDSTRLDETAQHRLAELPVKSARSAAYPSLAVGTYGAHHGLLAAPELTEEDRITACRQLVHAVADLAEEYGCTSHALLYTTTQLTRWLLPELGPQHQVAVLGAESVLECGGTSWQDYLDGLSSRRRGRILRERRMYLGGPATSDIATGPDAIGEDLVDLRCNLRLRYGLPEERERTVAEFTALARWCGDRLVVIRSRIEGDTVGFVICLRDGDTLFARTAGFDYDRLGSRDFCYFNIVYYDALEWGLPRGVHRLELGLAAYPAKRTRGCRFEPRFGVFTLPPDSPLRTALALQDQGERARLVAECGDAVPADELRLREGMVDGRHDV